jgi:hypothetical protein
LERDRGAVLTVRAAIRGVVDYSEAQVLDPDWWRRHYILLTAMAREDDQKIQKGVFDYHRALVANSGLTEESFKGAQTNARDAFYDLIGALRPWEGSSAKERAAKENEDMRLAWFQAFNIDPNDPDWEEKNKAKIAEWRDKRQAEREAYVDPEALLKQRMAARKKRLAQLREEVRRSRIWQGS